MAINAHSQGREAVTQPSGTVTFLFSDIEGSTTRWERDRDAMAAAMSRHDRLMRETLQARGAYVFKTVGDAFCAAFARPQEALMAASDAQCALTRADFSAVNGLPVRIALHAGTAEERDGDYFGPAVNRVARLLAIGHGGQVLISGSAAGLLSDEMPSEHSLRDLGLHRLKDLTQPERVYQLIAPHLMLTFPALHSLDEYANNLPIQLTSFVGREEDVRAIRQLLENSRLVTLVATGGAGKTRCAIQAGAEVQEQFVDGVWLIELAAISDASLVTAEVARVLGVREEPGAPLLDTVIAFLRHRRVLLVVDNCEHVIDAVRVVVNAILRGCPGTAVLATTRESFSVAGEHVYRLPPLALPPAGIPLSAKTARSYGAVSLFADRAKASDSRFTLSDENARAIVEIAARLDGIALAIELAAARSSVLSPQQLLRRLDERFRVLTAGDRSALARQQTLRATIDWSFDLLTQSERALFARLSVFAGGFTLQAATAVGAGGGLDDWDMLDALCALVDKSLLVAEDCDGDRRYRMLYSLREYGRERLAQDGEAGVTAARHARFYADFVAGLTPLAAGSEDVEWKQRFTEELDNVRAAIDWTVFQGHDSAVGLALLADIALPEQITAPHEALRWYETAARLACAMPNQIVHARILGRLAVLQWLTGCALEQRERTALHAVDVARSSNDPNELAVALANLGACYRWAGRFDDADKVFSQAYQDPQSLSRNTTKTVLRLWAVTDLQRGDVDLARRRFLEVARLERPGSEAHASALINLAELEFAAGHIDKAREAAREAQRTYARLNSIYLVAVLANLAAYALAAGDVDEARRDLREALDLQPTAGMGWACTLIGNHALLAGMLGDGQRAALLAGFTDAFYGARGETRQYTERHVSDRLMALLRGIYADGELRDRMRDGARLTLEQAIADAAAIHDANNYPAETPKGTT